jgi:hypothetical protein
MREKFTVKAISLKTKAVLLVKTDGQEGWVNASEAVKPYLSKLVKGEAEVELTADGKEIKFIKQLSSTPTPANEYRRPRIDWDEKSNAKTASVLISYAKDILQTQIIAVTPLCKTSEEATALVKVLSGKERIHEKAKEFLEVYNELVKELENPKDEINEDGTYN